MTINVENPQTPSLAVDEQAITVREVMGILFLRKWAILSVFTGVVASAAFMTFWFLTPIYEVSGTLIISNNNLTAPLIESMPITDFEKLASFHTQKDIIKSATLATIVVDKLDLGDKRVLSNLEKLRRWAKAQRARLGAILGIERWQKPEDRRASAIAALLDRIEIVTKPESQAMKIVYRARDPDEAAATLQTLISEYREYFHARIRERAEGVIEYIESKIGPVQVELNASEQALLRFKETDRMTLSQAPSTSGTAAEVNRPARRSGPPVTGRPGPTEAPKGSMFGMRLDTQDQPAHPGKSQEALRDEQAPRAESRPTTESEIGKTVATGKGGGTPARAPAAKRDDRGSLIGLTDSAMVQNELKLYVLAMEEELRKMHPEFSYTPAVVELRQKITTYVDALNQLPEKELLMMRLKREFDINQEAFVLLKRNLEKAKLVAGGQADMVHMIQVVESPTANEEPVSPRPRLTMILAVVFGLMFGIVWAIILDWLDHTISSPKDVQRFLGTRMLGSLPIL
jgi:uncharacterized protein involved in exopolysaccharide biosynthesis